MVCIFDAWLLCVGSLVPYLILFLLRLVELWHDKFFDRRYNENNFYLGRFCFYVIFFVHFIGLLAITIELDEHIDFVRDTSPMLYVSCLFGSIIFGFIILFLICYMILFCIVLCCCEITRNRWEMRIIWKSCCICCAQRTVSLEGSRTHHISFKN